MLMADENILVPVIILMLLLLLLLLLLLPRPLRCKRPTADAVAEIRSTTKNIVCSSAPHALASHTTM